MQQLDLAHSTIRQAISASAAGVRTAKFVRVDVSEVTNPGRYGLTFEVFFEPAGGKKTRLGTFSLFPPDNPGQFIVPTQGQVNREGSILVSMLVTDKVAPGMPLTVGIRRIALADH